jgi:trigger factor
LKSTIENLTPTRIKVQVEVPFSELKPSLMRHIKKLPAKLVFQVLEKEKFPHK